MTADTDDAIDLWDASEDPLLRELEQRIVTAVTGWYDASLGLRQIRDEKLWQREHKSFKSYCTNRWGRSTAYGLIWAGNVKDSLSARADTRALSRDLPQRHCELLYKFKNEDDRARIAKLIAPLTHKQAARVVTDEFERLNGKRPKKRKPRRSRCGGSSGASARSRRRPPIWNFCPRMQGCCGQRIISTCSRRFTRGRAHWQMPMRRSAPRDRRLV